MYSNIPDTRQEALEEWSIPHQDLTFKEVMRQGCFGDVHRGQWHGEVMIYTFSQCPNEEDEFWSEVECLSLIRHENIMLFMGACVESGHYAVITSMTKGPSLFEHIHLKQDTLTLATKISIARQIAQAISYMHAKKMVHRRLNSNNIILENRIKVCLIDQGVPKYGDHLVEYGCLPRGQLTYLSPELVRSANLEPPYFYITERFTAESDAYAFGTLLYELAAYKFPFTDCDIHTIILRSGLGDQENLDNIKCSTGMKALIANCWSLLPSKRPTFSDILKLLQDNAPLHKKFSSSEPEKLHTCGLIARTCR
ncbi:Serine/threonine-protein kinase-transforming protein Rmil [Halotydeus destructor]|nr:Serine/threonine-protein kinase-transforming protein Rmil [Halotydeus destructor]